eukprot:4915910-Pleurochrysis_carterae.AAC.2
MQTSRVRGLPASRFWILACSRLRAVVVLEHALVVVENGQRRARRDEVAVVLRPRTRIHARSAHVRAQSRMHA